jgi:hypothetical protein
MGMTLTENDPSIFATFFIYGSDGKPTWYTGQTNGDSNGNFTGLLYASTGPYFGAATIFSPATMTYACSNRVNTTATLYEVSLTGQGFEGRWIAGLGGGCTEDAHCSAVVK